MSSLRRGHANLLCIVPILSDAPKGETEVQKPHTVPSPPTYSKPGQAGATSDERRPTFLHAKRSSSNRRCTRGKARLVTLLHRGFLIGFVTLRAGHVLEDWRACVRCDAHVYILLTTARPRENAYGRLCNTCEPRWIRLDNGDVMASVQRSSMRNIHANISASTQPLFLLPFEPSCVI